METIEYRAAVTGHSVDAAGWLAEFHTGFAAIAGRFGRVEPRRQARSFLLGLLCDVDSRSCWQLAEQAGDCSPHAMQRLLGEAVWDADKVRDDVRATGQPIGEPLTGHTDTVQSVAIGRAGDRDVIVSGGDDRTVPIWLGLATAPIVVDLLNPVISLAVDPMTGRLYVAGANVICAFQL